MRRLGVISGVLAVALVASAFIATAASAVTFKSAQWLLNGAAIPAPVAVEIDAELTLTNLTGLGSLERTCSIIFVGTVGPGGADKITEMLDLALKGGRLSCINMVRCEAAEIEPMGLPWKTELELMEDGTSTFFNDLWINLEFKSFCTFLGMKVEEECKVPELAVEAGNEANGTVDLKFNSRFQELSELKLGECNKRKESLSIEGLGTVTLTGGGTLAVS